MKKIFATLAFFSIILIQISYSQNIQNGNFNNSANNWGCNPEAIYTETTYGGSDGNNRVAEVDQEAGLCQTVSGFTIGAVYRLSFLCSRRTNCGPTVQSMALSVSNGAGSASFSRNGTSFSLTSESLTFTATATTHTFTFTSTITGTCGLIVDNIRVSLVSGLPVEWVDMKAVFQDNAVRTLWTTETEYNNDYFTVERSADGAAWTAIGQVEAAGNSTQRTDYSFTDESPLSGISYYRIRQTDNNGDVSYSDIASVNAPNALKDVTVYPNPTESQVRVSGLGAQSFKLINALGTEVNCPSTPESDSEAMLLDLSALPKGIYYLVSASGSVPVIKR